ncbi:MAG: NifB/NifX family molybdenum-iron cluster-binding protein [Candidatus Paceibacterota bacterium]|jgi:predicted Fe-Mo cluster-binding NifX family protein
MKIAISSSGRELGDRVSELFGRCPYFLIVEINGKEIGEIQAQENANSDQTGGAGIAAAKFLAEMDVNAVIAQNIGPRAADVLKQFNIETYYFDGAGEDAVQNFISGQLKKTN